MVGYRQSYWEENDIDQEFLPIVRLNEKRGFRLLHSLFQWVKARIRYFIHNWIYTTNHKRIAVNYFLFVILAGIVGLILATAIRLEFAYPGVGIFAGDSLQYLTVASAHGVIMVFFMIMPLLFGAFANFLLPTQLGVHDVAFPRLNSAAFWFLPGGLIMLAQLICVDRRYQRMNCFNVREIQALLKQRFFPNLAEDVMWTHRIPSAVSALRFQQNGSITDLPHMLSSFMMAPKTASYSRSIPWKEKNYHSGDLFNAPTSPFDRLISLAPQALSIGANLLSQIASIWAFVIGVVSELVHLIGGLISVIVSCGVYISSLGSCLLLASYESRKTTPVPTMSLFASNLYQLTNPLFLPSVTLRQTCFSKSHRLSSWTDYLDAVYPVQEVTYVAYMFNAALLDGIYLVYFNWYMLRKELEHYPSFLLPQLWLYLKSCNSISSSLRCYWMEFVSLTLFTIGLNKDLKRFETLDQISIVYADAYLNYLTKVIKLLTFVADFAYAIWDLLKYSVQIFWTPGVGYHTLPLFSALHWEVRDRILLSQPLLTVTRNEFDNFVTAGKLIVKQYPIEMTLIPISDALIASKSTTLKASSLIFNPTNFSNFVDVYYRYVAGFYELHRMRQFYFSIFNSPLLSSPSLTPSTTTNFFDLPGRLLLLVLINIELAYNIYILNQAISFINFTTALNLFVIRVKKSCETLFTPYSGKFSFSVPLVLNYGVNLLWNDFKIVVKIIPRSLSEHFHNHFAFFYSESSLTWNLKHKIVETFPLYQEIRADRLFKKLNVERGGVGRHFKSQNPLLRYDYKTGDYFPKVSREQNLHLFPSLLALSSSVPFAPWFSSQDFKEMIPLTFSLYKDTTATSTSESEPVRSFSFDHTPLSPFFHIATSALKFDTVAPFTAWSNLNQQFYRLFLTSSLQQRVLTNWRHLKFTREAWRCKLLSARHQKTLFKRYLNEDGVFWSIERNARDLLPGWAMITPFSSRTRFTSVGKVDIGLMGVLLVLNSSIISAANFLVTYRYLSSLNNRKMRDARSFFAEGVMVASWMMIAANPMLVIGIIMLLSDRHWQTSFFDYSGGGDTILFQHMFWFFGHPEVYIILIPVFGFTNTTLSYYLRKRVSARASLMYSMYTIAFLGFFVWGHHMYMVGLAHTTRMLFSTLTVMISVPAATKLMHWCVTIANSAFVVELPLIFTLTFIFLFVSGGISGMCVAHTGMDVLFHDTFYVIGHFHVMLAGAAMFGSFGAFYFYFASIFGVKYSRLYSYMHFSYYLSGQIITVAPMFWLGYAGMPRRVLDYPAALGGWHSLISAGHLLSVAGIISFLIMIFDSLRQSRAATRTTLGINRFNTRLNFYLFEISRLKIVKQKFGYIFNAIFKKMSTLRRRPIAYFEEYESTLITYSFHKLKRGQTHAQYNNLWRSKSKNN